MKCNNERVLDLERRVAILEKQMHIPVDAKQHTVCRTLAEKYGAYVNKKEAANILGVTRATVYKMLKDGRLESKLGGSRVSVESIEQYINSPVKLECHEKNTEVHA